MKIVSLEIKKIGINKFYPKKNEVELDIKFNDGAEKQLLKTVDVSEPEHFAESILSELRKIVRRTHHNQKEGTMIDNYVNIVIKDEDKLLDDTSKFINTIGNKLDDINNKKDADGYLNLIRELKNLQLKF